MSDGTGWQRYRDLAQQVTVGVSAASRQAAGSVIRGLVTHGEAAGDRAERLVDDLLARSEANRAAMAALVRGEIEQALARLDLARRDDVERLEARVRHLEARLDIAGPGGERP
jgi:polyhydroxyalkanoate synthesis regulator phasin